jgi:hypothetical protein
LEFWEEVQLRVRRLFQSKKYGHDMVSCHRG